MEEKDLRRLEDYLKRIDSSYGIVEGRKDVKAFERLGIRVYRYSEKNLRKAKGEVIVLTDLDRAGEELAKRIEERLRENIHVERVDVISRRIIAGILNLQRFEEIDRKYEKYKEVIENG